MIKLSKEITLKQLLKEYKVKQKTLAKHLGKSPQWICTLLSNDIEDFTISQVREICNLLGLHVEIIIK